MKKQNGEGGPGKARRRAPRRPPSLEQLRHELEYYKKHFDKLWEHVSVSNDRLQHLEVQANLATRFLVVLCLEKLKMPLGALRKLIRRVEREALEDSQIDYLEQLFRMETKEPPHPPRHPPSGGPKEPKK